MSLILAPEILLRENTRNIPEYFPIQESAFLSALKLVREVNDELANAKLEMYIALQEETVDYSVAKSQNSFKNKIIGIIQRLVNFIQDKIDQFIKAMKKFFDADEKILKYKDEVVKHFVSTKESFEMNTFTVTKKMTDPNVPIVNPVIKIELLDMIENKAQMLFGRYNGAISKEDLEASLKNMEDLVIENAKKCEEFRGLLFGERDEVSKANYRDFIKNQLCEDPKSEKIDAARIMEAFDSLKDIKKLVDNISGSKAKLKKNYDPIIQKIKLYKAFGPYQKDATKPDPTKNIERMFTLVNRYFKEECETIIQNINSQIMAISYKIDILKTYHAQERRICSTAITKAKGTKEEAVAASALICDNNDVLNEDTYGIYYDLFLIDEMSTQYGLQIDLSRILEEAGIEDIETMSINEAGALKSALDKLVAKIADMFGVFTRWLGDITKADQEFLKKNKDIILKNAFKPETLKGTHPYKISELSTVEIPPLYYEQMKNDLDSEDSFIKKEFPEYASKMKDGVSFRDVVKTEMAGSAEKEDISTDQYNVADVYNYCANFNGSNGTYANIKKEISILQKSNNEITRLVKDIDSKQSNNTQQVNASYSYITAGEMLNEKALGSKDRKKLDNDSFGLPDQEKYPMPDKQHVHSAIIYFNRVDEKDEERLAKNIIKKIKQFHMEDEVHVTAKNRFSKYYKRALKEAEIGGDDSDDKSSTNTNSNGAPNQQVGDADNDKKTTDQIKDDIKKSADSGDNAKDLGNRIKVYFKVCGDYLGAKLTIARWAYLDYMKLLHWHTKNFNGGDNKGEKATNTNTNNDNTTDEPIDIAGAGEGEKKD